MAKHNMTPTAVGQFARRVSDLSSDHLFGHLLAIVHEWRARRDIQRSLCHLSHSLLRDAGLTNADVEAACTGRIDQSASRVLKGAAQNRSGNW